MAVVPLSSKLLSFALLAYLANCCMTRTAYLDASRYIRKFNNYGIKLTATESHVEALFSCYTTLSSEVWQLRQHFDTFGNNLVPSNGVWDAEKILTTFNAPREYLAIILVQASGLLLQQYTITPSNNQIKAEESLSKALEHILSNVTTYPFTNTFERLSVLDHCFNSYLSIYRLKKYRPFDQEAPDQLGSMERVLDHFLSQLTDTVLQLPGGKELLIGLFLEPSSPTVQCIDSKTVWAVSLLLFSAIVWKPRALHATFFSGPSLVSKGRFNMSDPSRNKNVI